MAGPSDNTNFMKRRSNETNLQFARRRLGTTRSAKQQFRAIMTLSRDFEAFFSSENCSHVRNIVRTIHGRRWPRNVKACTEWNANLCGKSFFHKARSGSEEIDVIHCCANCIENLDVGAFHPIVECTMIKQQDDYESAQQQQQQQEIQQQQQQQQQHQLQPQPQPGIAVVNPQE